MRSNNDASVAPYAASVIVGFAACYAITVVTGKKEAWDSNAYFSIGIPIMCAAIFFISYRFSKDTWRWALTMAVGQSIAIALAGGSLSLWPLAIIAMTIVSVPQFITALAAGRLALRRDRETNSQG